MDNEHMQAAIKDLQDAMVVMAHVEKQQSEHIRDLREFQHGTEQNLAEITDKLDGLV
jgi:soluble cytochrome b562